MLIKLHLDINLMFFIEKNKMNTRSIHLITKLTIIHQLTLKDNFLIHPLFLDVQGQIR